MVRTYLVSTDADDVGKKDVGKIEGKSWMLSSAKPQHGVAQLMSDDLDTLWQCVGQHIGLTAGVTERSHIHLLCIFHGAQLLLYVLT